MTYTRVVAGIPDLSVIFELEDGVYALVGTEKDIPPQYSLFAESFLKFGTFGPPDELPEDTINQALSVLSEISAPDVEFTYEQRQAAKRLYEKSNRL
ncbi:MAG: hypothetical protein RR547_09650 [Raoultibacter sp.]